jgi:hypothetical protein
MIQDLSTAWLYGYSPNANTPTVTYHTVFTGDPNGRAAFATVSSPSKSASAPFSAKASA